MYVYVNIQYLNMYELVYITYKIGKINAKVQCIRTHLSGDTDAIAIKLPKV